MPRLGEGTTPDEKRVEAVVRHVLGELPNIDRRTLRYVQVVGVVASPMHSGVDGDGWLLETEDGASFFLKLYGHDTEEFINLGAGFRAAAVAAAAGIAPQLLWQSESLRAAMWEWKGSGWRTASFDDSWSRDRVPRVSRALRKLHGAPNFGQSRDVFKTLESYIELAQKRAISLPSDLGWMLSNVRNIGLAIAAAGTDHRPCHGDLIASNILIGPLNETLFVDWDEAGDSDPYWDIGMYMAEAFPFDQPALEMIEDYTGRADRKLLARARLYGIAGDLAWAVRSLILAHQSERTEVEYFKYGQWRALRCRVALHDPKFEQMLRSL